MSTAVEKGSEKVSTWVVDPAHTSVEFAVKHMMFTTVRGRFTGFEVDLDFDPGHPERSSMEARIEAATIDTRNADRDAHLRSGDFLLAEEHPHIVFKSRRIEPIAQGTYRVVGDLSIRGVTRETALEASFGGTGKSPWGQEVASFSAEAKINRKDFGLNWNAALETGGVLVGDEVKILLEVEAIKQA